MSQLDSLPRIGSFAGLAADDVGRSDERAPLVLLHGLTFDRTMWRPSLAELESIDPGRRAVALDLPGHGASPDAPSYLLEAIVEHVHAAVLNAGLDRPVIVGHSAAAGTATVYAAMYPTSGVVAVEGTLNVGAFAGMAQSLEPILRGPGFAEAWKRITDNVFRLDEVAPDVGELVRRTSRPRQDVVLGYWTDLFDRTPQELDRLVASGAAAIRAAGVPFTAVLGSAPSPQDEAWVQANLPESRTLVWPNSGHFPHLAYPRRFAELLAETGTWAARTTVASGKRTT